LEHRVNFFETRRYLRKHGDDGGHIG